AGTVLADYRALTASGEPIFRAREVGAPGSETLRVLRLLMPLSARGDALDMILSAMRVERRVAPDYPGAPAIREPGAGRRWAAVGVIRERYNPDASSGGRHECAVRSDRRRGRRPLSRGSTPAPDRTRMMGCVLAADIDARVTAIEWRNVGAALDDEGCAVVGPLLEPVECGALAAAYDDDGLFRKRVVMAHLGYGRGEYRYFAYP